MKKIFVLFALLALFSCERRHLVEGYQTTALIPINIDWSDAKLDPDDDPDDDVYSASAWFFPDDTSQTVIQKRLTDASGGTVELPVGTYSVLIFNNTVSDFSNIQFRGTDSFDTFEAYSGADTKSVFYSKSDATEVTSKPEILASWSITDFEVTEEMVTTSRTIDLSTLVTATASTSTDITASTSTKTSTTLSTKAAATRTTEENLATLTSVKPQLVVDTASVVVHVQGLNNASSASGTHTGLASSVFMASGTTSDDQITHSFTLSDRSYYDGSSSDGTVSASYRSFGRHSDRDDLSHSMSIDFTLNDDSSHPTQEFDITDQVHSTDDRLGLLTTVGLSDSDTDHTIVLPDVDTDSDGFSIGLDDWDTEVDIPLDI